MKEEYTAKEILLGLSSECLKVQKKLNQVDNFLDYDRDKYKKRLFFKLLVRGDNIEFVNCNKILTKETIYEC